MPVLYHSIQIVMSHNRFFETFDPISHYHEFIQPKNRFQGFVALVFVGVCLFALY